MAVPVKRPVDDRQKFIAYVTDPRQLSAIRAVAATDIDPGRVARVLLNTVARNPQLQACTTTSIFRATLQAVELGLDTGSAQHAYLVPYGTEATLVIGYRGLVELAWRSGVVKELSAHAVYEGDVFEWELGDNEHIRHIPGDGKGELTHAYAIVRLTTGGVLRHVLRRHEIDRIRSQARSKGGPWTTHYDRMAVKSALRRALNYAPSPNLRKALAVDDVDEGAPPDILADFAANDYVADEQAEPADPAAELRQKVVASTANIVAAPRPHDEPVTGEAPASEEPPAGGDVLVHMEPTAGGGTSERGRRVGRPRKATAGEAWPEPPAEPDAASGAEDRAAPDPHEAVLARFLEIPREQRLSAFAWAARRAGKVERADDLSGLMQYRNSILGESGLPWGELSDAEWAELYRSLA